MNTKQKFDIAIIGAGPAGSSAALSLRNSQYKIALFERATYPRNKICGDGICDRSINVLKEISPDYYAEFLETLNPLCIHNTKLFYKNRSFDVNFNSFGYSCSRWKFDEFLFRLVQRDCPNVQIFQDCPIMNVERTSEGFCLKNTAGEDFQARMVLVCNGATSKIARSLTNLPYDKTKMGVAVRAYYKGVADTSLDAIELHYKKEFFPGYLWIFPQADGVSNVGFGCHLTQNSVGENNIRSVFENWIEQDENLKKRFASAERISPLQGGMIPYNSDEFHCFGDNFFICGDAASLIDPISGGGIGSAMLSGRYAALQAQICLDSGDLSAHATEQYQVNLCKRVKREMHIRYALQQRIARHTAWLDVLAFVARWSFVFNKIKKWYLD